jgi:hypothetical protein
LYRVYPENWQVVWENVRPGKTGDPQVEYVTVAVLEKRPSYAEVVKMLLDAKQKA